VPRMLVSHRGRGRSPWAAKIRLAYISTDKDIWEYLGPRHSFIGVDESTFHSEYQVRNMLGRLSSTDKTLRLGMRLTSNPGLAKQASFQRGIRKGKVFVGSLAMNQRSMDGEDRQVRQRC
jgi:hypothetical protein